MFIKRFLNFPLRTAGVLCAAIILGGLSCNALGEEYDTGFYPALRDDAEFMVPDFDDLAPRATGGRKKCWRNAYKELLIIQESTAYPQGKTRPAYQFRITLKTEYGHTLNGILTYCSDHNDVGIISYETRAYYGVACSATYNRSNGRLKLFCSSNKPANFVTLFVPKAGGCP